MISMYISNTNDLKNKYYECSSLIGKYLIKKGIPLLSLNGKKMVFSKTKRLQKVIDNMPFYLQVLIKVGVVDG